MIFASVIGPEEFLGINIGTIKLVMMIVFFVAFVAMAVRVILARADKYKQRARIPLDDQEVVTPRTPQHKEAQ